jgi:hypothetical protein
LKAKCWGKIFELIREEGEVNFVILPQLYSSANVLEIGRAHRKHRKGEELTYDFSYKSFRGKITLQK